MFLQVRSKSYVLSFEDTGCWYWKASQYLSALPNQELPAFTKGVFKVEHTVSGACSESFQKATTWSSRNRRKLDIGREQLIHQSWFLHCRKSAHAHYCTAVTLKLWGCLFAQHRLRKSRLSWESKEISPPKMHTLSIFRNVLWNLEKTRRDTRRDPGGYWASQQSP